MIECTYFYPMKHVEGKPQWIIGHCGFRFTNWKLSVVDCALVKGKDGGPCFISPPNKSYMKGGKKVYVKFWSLDDEEVFEEFQKEGKAAIVRLMQEKGMEIPEDLCA